MLAALHLYQLISPEIVFIILGIISLLTMFLALRYGPVLAIIGILGAYVVPLLVFSDSGTILTAMLYSLLISAAALMLMRYVYRSWLWYGMLAGGLGWWLLSCFHGESPLRIVEFHLIPVMRLSAYINAICSSGNVSTSYNIPVHGQGKIATIPDHFPRMVGVHHLFSFRISL